MTNIKKTSGRGFEKTAPKSKIGPASYQVEKAETQSSNFHHPRNIVTLSGMGVTSGLKDLTFQEKCQVKSQRYLDKLLSTKDKSPAVGQYNLKDKLYSKVIYTGPKCKR